MLIRPAIESDAEGIATLRRETIIAVNARDYPPDVIDNWANRVDAERIRKTAAEVKRWVAVTRERMDELLLGFCDHTLDDNELSRLYTHKDYQGEGVGSRLLEVAEASMLEQGREEVYLYSTITARDFYLRHGYVVVEETVDAHNPKITVIKMAKKLSNPVSSAQ